MSEVSNLQWCNLNEIRNYPFEDGVSKLSDAGVALPDNVVVDLSIAFPGTLGQEAFVSSVGITKNLVSITVCAKNGSTFTPLAAFSSKVSDVNPYFNYDLKPLSDGVAGWVSFGKGIESVGNWLFSDTTQTKLLPKVAWAYSEDGVTSIGKLNTSDKLSGDIKLKSDGSEALKIEYVSSTSALARVVNGSPVNAIVLSLNTDTFGKELYERFLGPCDTSPESGTCRKPVIFAINGAIPNCSGEITLNFSETSSNIYPVFAVERVSSNLSIIEVSSNMDQATACALINPVFKDICPDNCLESVDTGPFTSYSAQFGSYNPLECSA